VSALAAERDRVLTNFREFAAVRGEADPPWLAALRREAIDRFADLGFPSRKREEWKYTPVDPIARALAGAPASPERGPLGARIAAAIDTSAMAHSFVFVNGRFRPELSAPGALPHGAVVDGLTRVLGERPGLVRPRLDRRPLGDGRCLVALNSAFQTDGAVVALSPGVVVNEPIHLLFVTTEEAEGTAVHGRNLITVADGASVVVVERHCALGDAAHLVNSVTDAVLGANAQLDHVGLVDSSPRAIHTTTLNAEVGRDARLRSHAVALGGALIRNEIGAVLAEEGAECVLNGIYVAGDGQHIDNQTTIDHAKPFGTSREVYKGILGGRSRGVFNGKVIVQPNAQKSDARQYNPNLLLSEGAEVDTRPNLEIYADDVKCAHGSTVGRLDDDALFFLRSRGIGEREARQMLGRAFAADVVEALPSEALRAEVAALVARAIDRIGEPR